VFPPGMWTSLWNGAAVSGPATLNVNTPLDENPVYLKPGAVVPVQLNEELQFGESMTHGRVDALVVTRPTENIRVSMLNARGEVAGVAGRSKAYGGSWTIENFPEMSYLLVYGTTEASAVRVNGQVLPKLTAESNAVPTGWKVDLAGNRLVICLPSRQIEQSQPVTEIEVDSNQSGRLDH